MSNELINQILEEYKAIAFANIDDFIKINYSNKIKVNFKKSSSAIAQICEVKNKYGQSIKIKLHNKLVALEFLAKYIGLFSNNESMLDKLLNASPEKIQDLINKIK